MSCLLLLFTFCLLLVHCFLIPPSLGHVVWDFPSPRYNGDDRLKLYPCGDASQYNQFNGPPVSTLQPGFQALSFRETIAHAGAPFRIALSIGSDDKYDQWILLDHIPHFTNAISDTRYRVGVIIPDVQCKVEDKCALQIIQVMVDKFSTPCPNPSGLVNSCGQVGYVYFSCANVVINGSQNASSFPSIYNSVLNTSNANARTPYQVVESSDFILGEDGRYSLPGTPNLRDPINRNITAIPSIAPGSVVTREPSKLSPALVLALIGVSVGCFSLSFLFGLGYLIYLCQKKKQEGKEKGGGNRRSRASSMTVTKRKSITPKPLSRTISRRVSKEHLMIAAGLGGGGGVGGGGAGVGMMQGLNNAFGGGGGGYGGGGGGYGGGGGFAAGGGGYGGGGVQGFATGVVIPSVHSPMGYVVSANAPLNSSSELSKTSSATSGLHASNVLNPTSLPVTYPTTTTQGSASSPSSSTRDVGRHIISSLSPLSDASYSMSSIRPMSLDLGSEGDSTIRAEPIISISEATSQKGTIEDLNSKGDILKVSPLAFSMESLRSGALSASSKGGMGKDGGVGRAGGDAGDQRDRSGRFGDRSRSDSTVNENNSQGSTGAPDDRQMSFRHLAETKPLPQLPPLDERIISFRRLAETKSVPPLPIPNLGASPNSSNPTSPRPNNNLYLSLPMNPTSDRSFGMSGRFGGGGGGGGAGVQTSVYMNSPPSSQYAAPSPPSSPKLTRSFNHNQQGTGQPSTYTTSPRSMYAAPEPPSPKLTMSFNSQPGIYAAAPAPPHMQQNQTTQTQNQNQNQNQIQTPPPDQYVLFIGTSDPASTIAGPKPTVKKGSGTALIGPSYPPPAGFVSSRQAGNATPPLT